jgi:hypothetical protein
MDALLGDPDIELAGYQPSFEDLESGLFLFNHRSCASTLAIAAREFRPLYGGPVLASRSAQPDACPSYCQHQSDLTSCPVECECAYVRDVAEAIRNWRKRAPA